MKAKELGYDLDTEEGNLGRGVALPHDSLSAEFVEKGMGLKTDRKRTDYDVLWLELESSASSFSST